MYNYYIIYIHVILIIINRKEPSKAKAKNQMTVKIFCKHRVQTKVTLNCSIYHPPSQYYNTNNIHHYTKHRNSKYLLSTLPFPLSSLHLSSPHNFNISHHPTKRDN